MRAESNASTGLSARLLLAATDFPVTYPVNCPEATCPTSSRYGPSRSLIDGGYLINSAQDSKRVQHLALDPKSGREPSWRRQHHRHGRLGPHLKQLRSVLRQCEPQKLRVAEFRVTPPAYGLFRRYCLSGGPLGGNHAVGNSKFFHLAPLLIGCRGPRNQTVNLCPRIGIAQHVIWYMIVILVTPQRLNLRGELCR